MKRLACTLISGIFLTSLAITSFAVEVTLQKAFVITADESHKQVIKMAIPNKTIVSVAFTGSDSAIEVHANNKEINVGGRKGIRNKGKTVIIGVNFGRKTPKDQVIPVHILTKEGRTHTIALISLGPKYAKESVVVKAVITADTKTSK